MGVFGDLLTQFREQSENSGSFTSTSKGSGSFSTISSLTDGDGLGTASHTSTLTFPSVGSHGPSTLMEDVATSSLVGLSSAGSSDILSINSTAAPTTTPRSAILPFTHVEEQSPETTSFPVSLGGALTIDTAPSFTTSNAPSTPRPDSTPLRQFDSTATVYPTASVITNTPDDTAVESHTIEAENSITVAPIYPAESSAETTAPSTTISAQSENMRLSTDPNIFASSNKLFPLGIVVIAVAGVFVITTMTYLIIRLLGRKRRRKNRDSELSFIQIDEGSKDEKGPMKYESSFETITTNMVQKPSMSVNYSRQFAGGVVVAAAYDWSRTERDQGLDTVTYQGFSMSTLGRAIQNNGISHSPFTKHVSYGQGGNTGQMLPQRDDHDYRKSPAVTRDITQPEFSSYQPTSSSYQPTFSSHQPTFSSYQSTSSRLPIQQSTPQHNSPPKLERRLSPDFDTLSPASPVPSFQTARLAYTFPVPMIPTTHHATLQRSTTRFTIYSDRSDSSYSDVSDGSMTFDMINRDHDVSSGVGRVGYGGDRY